MYGNLSSEEFYFKVLNNLKLYCFILIFYTNYLSKSYLSILSGVINE